MRKVKAPSWRQLAEELSRDEMARLRWKVLCCFHILPASRAAKKIRDRDVLRCAVHMALDVQERLDGLGPQCRSALSQSLCPGCGKEAGEENPAFDPLRFEELKHRG